MYRRLLDPPRLRGLGSVVWLVAICTGSGTFHPLLGQGVATGAVRGTVRSEDGRNLEAGLVRVLNTATGFSIESEVRHGRFLVLGLELGGPYLVTVRQIGFVPERSEPIWLRLGEPIDVSLVLHPTALRLEDLQVATSELPASAESHPDGGIGTTIGDSLLHRLPTLNRDFYDFARLVPQVSTRVGLPSGGLTGGGVGFRFNNFLVDGSPERFLTGNSSLAFNGGKSVPLEAVQEYQVLLTPFDVRYGDFAGALINAITRSGTNQVHGSAFGYWRNDQLRRDVGAAGPYDRWQYGFSLGGPLVRNRLHFFVAPEWQSFTSRAAGPYIGALSTASPAAPVSASELARLDDIMRGFGLVAGSGGPVSNGNPLANVFARLDFSLPRWNSRVVGSINYLRNTSITFSRAATDTFPLSIYQLSQPFSSRLISLQLQTTLRRAGGGHNQLLLSRRSDGGEWLSEVHQPIVLVAVPSTSGGLVTVESGTHQAAQGMFSRSWTIRLADHFTLPVGRAHELGIGLEVERFRIDRGGVVGAYGTWTFSSLDSLAQGIAQRFLVRRDFGSATVPLSGGQYAAYLSDRWRLGGRLTLTGGIRAEVLAIGGAPPYNPTVDSIFGRRTDQMPGRPVGLAPRLGFTWAMTASGRHQLRGGMGVFTGRPPLNWIHSTLYSYGVGIGVLRCGVLPTDAGPPPPFVPDYRAAPTACQNGSGLSAAPLGDVDLLDPHSGMIRVLRGALAYDWRLGQHLSATGEVLVSWNRADFAFVNLNLRGIQATDQFGRVLYGSIGPSGVAKPAVRSGFSEVIDLVNTSRNHSVQLSVRLERRFAGGFGATASYTYSRVRDVETPLRAGTPGIVIWAGARAVSGPLDDLASGVSLYDVPHRIVLAGTYSAPWRRWTTIVSFYYVGESGSPFTYLAWGVGSRGDLNADGSNGNDPIYVPRNVSDPTEIRFSGVSDSLGADNSVSAQAARVSRQQVGFEGFIRGAGCLAGQRGRIMERNSCREPFAHTTIVSVRQTIPIAGRGFEAELDLFNLLNLLSSAWGSYRVAAPALLEQVGQITDPADQAQPVFRFDVTRAQWTTLPTESAFQFQAALRFHF